MPWSAMADEAVNWIDLIAKAGPAMLLAMAFFAGYKNLWLFRSQHEEIIALYERENVRLEEERKRERERGDKWEAMAVRLMETGREAIAITAKAVEKGQSHERE